MKKAKMAVAALAAAVLGTSALGLAACGPKTPINPDEGTPGGNTPNTPTQNSLTVTFDANDGAFAGGKTQVTATVKANGTIDFPTAPERESYEFAGYNFKKDGSGNTVVSTTKFTEDTTVYARWELIGSGGDNTGSGGDNTGSGGDNTGSGGDNTGSGGDNTGSGGDNTGSGGDNTGSGGDNTQAELVMSVGGTASSTQFTKNQPSEYVGTQDGGYYALNVRFEADDELSFKVNGSAVKLFRDGYDEKSVLNVPNDPSTAQDSLSVSRGGSFTVALKHYPDNPTDVWVLTVSDPNATVGGGNEGGNEGGDDNDGDNLADGVYIDGSSIGALTVNIGNRNEVMLTGVAMEAGKSFKIVVNGSYVKDFTIKADSSIRVSHTVGADGSVSVETSGTFNFYYDTTTKILYVGHNPDVVATLSPWEAGGYYVLGAIDASGMSWDNSNGAHKGLPMTDNGDGTYSITLTIGAGDNFKFVNTTNATTVGTWYCGNNDNKTDDVFYFAGEQGGGDDNIKLRPGQTGGTYTFTLNPSDYSITYTVA